VSNPLSDATFQTVSYLTAPQFDCRIAAFLTPLRLGLRELELFLRVAVVFNPAVLDPALRVPHDPEEIATLRPIQLPIGR
jgi:hypothetical protein